MRAHPFVTSLGLLAVGLLCRLAPAQDVKYEKYKLDNGLTVILHEDHTLPLAAVNIWYRVGSKDEPERRSGFAHLFEHLMFMGTQRVPGNQFDVIMESGGGNNNASTSSDRTNYFSHGPAALLPTLLWLDADRLQDLARTMDLDKLNKQRDIVRNERRQSNENTPYGKAELRIPEMMFPPGHPYHIPTIGTHEDLEAATVTDVKDFFATYYVPNNAALVVAGDFKPAEIKPLIAQLFGAIPRGGEAMHRTAPPVTLGRVLRTTMLDQVQIPKIVMGFESAAQFADGDAEMNLVGALLSQGKSSRLYKRLVIDEKLASDVSAYQDSGQIASTFRVDVMTQPAADLDRVERIVDEELARFLSEGPRADELEQRKASVELAMLAQLESVERVADKLNEYEYFWGEPNSFKRDLDRYRQATPQSVQQWARKVLTLDSRLVLRILPEAPERDPSALDKRPSPLAQSEFQPAPPQTVKLSNGIDVIVWPRRELPLISTLLLLRTGADAAPSETAGLASLTADMLDEGAGALDALQFADKLESLGAEFSASAAHENITASLTVLARNYAPAIGLVADAVRRPRMAETDWQRVQRLRLEDLKEQQDDPRRVAGVVGPRALFGKDNPYGWPTSGTPETVARFTLADVKKEHQALFDPARITLLVAGDIDPAAAKDVLDKAFGDWKSSNPPQLQRASYAAKPIGDALRVVLVHKPEAVQTVIQFIMPGPTLLDAGRVKYRLLNTMLGGSFTSRLNQNLREAHGYTYGAGSRYAMEASTGHFVASSSVRADVTGKALEEFLKEIQRIRGGDISAEEVTKAAETLRMSTIATFAGLGGVLGQSANLLAAGLPLETITQDLAALQKASAGELNQLAREAIPLEKGVLVLIGDRNLIRAQIKDLSLPEPVELDTSGNPLTKSQ